MDKRKRRVTLRRCVGCALGNLFTILLYVSLHFGDFVSQIYGGAVDKAALEECVVHYHYIYVLSKVQGNVWKTLKPNKCK